MALAFPLKNDFDIFATVTDPKKGKAKEALQYPENRHFFSIGKQEMIKDQSCGT
ncbi:hypothetical protein [Bartonella phoceensis]|uniref:hypothetical protein n=1 Tax=Bartonella phoceensis TaxID=270249 RepID=UPI001ABA30DF|nr:hypothetical protein [Bartonella phoceensis]